MTYSDDQVLFLDNDTVYGADELGLPYRDLVNEGVVDWNAGEFAVSERSAGANMSVDVLAGACWIKGDDSATLQPTYRYREANQNVAVSAADATNPRIDIVIAEILDSAFSGSSKLGRVRVVAGTPAPVPSEPSLPNNAIKLAKVSVGAGVTQIFDANIIDRRPPAFVGGRPQVFTAAQFAFLSAAADSTWDGKEIELEVDSTNGVYWRFRYRSASASSYKWEFVGGPDLIAEVLTDQSTSSTSYTALTTAGPSISVPVAGEFDVEVGSNAYNNTAAVTNYHSYDIGGTAASDNDASLAGQPSGGNTGHASGVRPRRKTLTVASSLVSKYKVSAGTGNWRNRWMRVRPVRIG